MTISATDILVPVCSKIPLLYLLTQKVAQKFGYVLGIKNFQMAIGQTKKLSKSLENTIQELNSSRMLQLHVNLPIKEN